MTTGVTRDLTPGQARELAPFEDGRPRPRASTNLIRRDLVRSVGKGLGYAITPFGRDVLALHRPARLSDDDLWPRDDEHRYRLYARQGTELRVLATSSTAGGIGQAIVTLHEDEKAVGRRLADRGVIGVLDVMSGGARGEWVILPWERTT